MRKGYVRKYPVESVAMLLGHVYQYYPHPYSFEKMENLLARQDPEYIDRCVDAAIHFVVEGKVRTQKNFNPEMRKTVIERRYGLLGQGPETFSKIAADLNRAHYTILKNNRRSSFDMRESGALTGLCPFTWKR